MQDQGATIYYRRAPFLVREKGMNPLFRGSAVALAPKPTD
jgi:hypothetical protein